ncbi:hypothetical protein BJX68DRAFT_266737 [Aspergillus pseudodeflectus]|uniref:Uncharacterized protein n=1 Tax=Aspergillus pseudodeflectus TaxID=176178 RepID=A0ABR4KE44_9EURO
MNPVSTLNVESLFLEVCGITRSNDPIRSIWRYTHEPERFAFTASLLQEYATGFTLTGEVSDLPARVRINAILVMSLAFAKTKVLGRANARQFSAAEDRLRTLFWGHDQGISLWEAFLSKCEIRQAAIHYVLWYGDPGELETNLVVIRVDEPLHVAGDNVDCLRGLAAASMVHHSRNTQPVLEETYGIVTDGLRWLFFFVGKEDEYSSLSLDWSQGEVQQHAVVGLIGKILDRAVTVKMTSPRLGCLSEWDGDEVADDDWLDHSLHGEFQDEDDLNPQPSSYLQRTDNTTKMQWFTRLEADYKEFIQRLEAGVRGCDFKAKMTQAFNRARSESKKEELDEKKPMGKSKGFSGFGKTAKPIESVAVGDIKPTDVLPTFKLRLESREHGPPPYWNLSPSEIHNVSRHLRQTLDNIRLVYGEAAQNEAVIRLIIDAIRKVDQAGVRNANPVHLQLEQGQEKLPGKDGLYLMVWATGTGRGVHGRGRGEVPQTGKDGDLSGHILYGFDSVARRVAGREQSPIYGVSSDGGDWEFVRMDARGNVDIEKVSWAANQERRIISILYNKGGITPDPCAVPLAPGFSSGKG